MRRDPFKVLSRRNRKFLVKLEEHPNGHWHAEYEFPNGKVASVIQETMAIEVAQVEEDFSEWKVFERWTELGRDLVLRKVRRGRA